MSSTAQVFLVPGFFGFQTIAGLPYFSGVGEVLRSTLAELGVEARVHALDTLPTASLESRARHLGQRIARLAGDDLSPIHLVGHSTGGLDARVLISPHTDLAPIPGLERLVARVRSLVTLASPHHGTPLADYVVRVEGQKLLRLVSLLSVHGLRLAGRPLLSAVSLGRVLARVDELVSLRESALDRAYKLLADPLSSERVRPIEDFFDAVRSDQSLLRQLKPTAMAGFGERFGPNPAVGYGSVMTRARPPRLRGAVEVGLDPVGQLTHAVYQGLYRLSATQDPQTLPEPGAEQREALVVRYGKVPDTSANDGLVPTRSQIHGEVLHVARADHHDVIGYFDDASHDPPHLDWVVTGCGFRRDDFERLWSDVARFMARHTRAMGPRTR